MRACVRARFSVCHNCKCICAQHMLLLFGVLRSPHLHAGCLLPAAAHATAVRSSAFATPACRLPAACCCSHFQRTYNTTPSRRQKKPDDHNGGNTTTVDASLIELCIFVCIFTSASERRTSRSAVRTVQRGVSVAEARVPPKISGSMRPPAPFTSCFFFVGGGLFTDPHNCSCC